MANSMSYKHMAVGNSHMHVMASYQVYIQCKLYLYTPVHILHNYIEDAMLNCL